MKRRHDGSNEIRGAKKRKFTKEMTTNTSDNRELVKELSPADR